ncbi:putative outer membrane protein pmp20 precursor [Enhygromyxa salina]|uniref:Putative outer membrane protein pmp20 n=1 Tax=Enhygromyxa salina TaxID=215803 RepID=A0A2S9XV93_9BACT|nr:LamG-like jellyroll fold domain-containing protein [Enhygromyxa salina]PRP96789.1 putative outer membrane protein pmp20 precursor [Enhygromyxa salina]
MTDQKHQREFERVLTWWVAVMSSALLVGCAPGEADDGPLEPSFRGLEDGLMLHWTFEDHAGLEITDLSGNERHGELKAGATLVPSPLGEAVKLDGVDDYISFYVNRNPANYGGVDGSLTVSARIKLDAVDKYNALCAGCGPFSILYAGTAGQGDALLAGFDNQGGDGLLWTKSEPALTAGTWTQVTLVVENGTSVHYYVDCAAAGQFDNPELGLFNPLYSAVGRSGDPAWMFGGEIDELRIWNRALDAEELDQLCPAPPSLDDALELYWTFEDSVGAEITDLSGNDRHGTLEAGATLVDSPAGQAVALDGVDDYVSLVGPRDPAIFGGADGSFSISARVKLADVDKYNTLCTGCGPFSTFYAGAEGLGAVLIAALDDQGGGKLWPLSEPLLSANTWTWVTLVVENGASARYYIDCAAAGELDNSDIGLFDPGFSAVGLSSNPDRWFGGEIDELRVWSRALTDDDLDQLCPAPDPLDQDLELHWTFEDHQGDQITDLSGNDRHGQKLGGVFVASPEGQALSLDGVADKVSLTGPRALALYGGETGDFTLSAQVKLADVDKYNNLCFGCGPHKAFYLGDPNLGGRVQVNLENLDDQANLWTTSSPALTNDEWAEVTLVVEGGVAARTYIDCALDSTLDGNVGLIDPGYSALGESGNSDWWFGGEIDELRVWSRALSDEDLERVCPTPPPTLCDGPILVDLDAAPGGDGMTWATAFDEIQTALDAGSECTNPQLWIAEGQYAPSLDAHVATITYPVEIYGGFAGTEAALAQREVDTYPVRLGADASTLSPIRIEASSLGFPADVVRIDGVRIIGGLEHALSLGGTPVPQGTLQLAKLTVTDGPQALWLPEVAVEISESRFERLSASRGGAIYMRYGGSVTITDSVFRDNQASDRGGAIIVWDPLSLTISGSSFTGNTAEWGGAVYVWNDPDDATYAQLSVTDTSFIANSAGSGGGAMYLEESTVNLDALVFNDNSADYGGAIYLRNGAADADVIEIRNSRFVGNHATNGAGGAMRLQDSGVTVVNSEFVDNDATTAGGGVWGRADFFGCTFTGNTANSGPGLYAPAGAAMVMDHCVAYPDTIVGPDIQMPYSCVVDTAWVQGAPLTLLGPTPFAPADLDDDGLTEHYLIPEGPCVGLDGGVIDAFDWSALTVEASQCTDDGWPEPGVHYSPQAEVGPCS